MNRWIKIHMDTDLWDKRFFGSYAADISERVKKVFLPRSARFSELWKSSESLLYRTRRDTLTVSLHRTLSSEIVGRSGF